MITDADIDKKLSIQVKAIDQAEVEITSLLINFSSQFDDEHQEQYAQAMSLIKNRFDENLMFIGAWLTTGQIWMPIDKFSFYCYFEGGYGCGTQ